jgi:hypothetical protein
MRTILLTSIFIALAVPISAQDFNKGWDPYTSSDYAVAANE